MDIIISPASAEPIYKQISRQISAQILRGDLAADDPLPPIRTVAKELKISIITVKKAWEELDRAGLIYTSQGRGSFVRPQDGSQISNRDNIACQQLQKDLAYYKELGYTKEELLKLINELF